MVIDIKFKRTLCLICHSLCTVLDRLQAELVGPAHVIASCSYSNVAWLKLSERSLVLAALLADVGGALLVAHVAGDS